MRARADEKRNRAAKATGQLIFLSVELSYCLFSFFVEAGLLNCINCNPVPRGTRNHPDEASEKFASLQTDSGLQLDLEIALSGALSEGPAPRPFSPAEDALKTSGDVIEQALPTSGKIVERYLRQSLSDNALHNKHKGTYFLGLG